MTTFGLRQAAIQAGTSKSTILRAIQSGRLSAARTDDGRYALDPALAYPLCAHGGRSGACVSTRKADIELHRLRLQFAGTTRYQLRRGDTIRDGPSKIPGGEYSLTAVDPQGAVSGLVGPRT